jgi:endonuclease YncB( thermonuclease family)
MTKISYLLSSTILGLAFAASVAGQIRPDAAELRDRFRARQRVIENPANNPIKIEEWERLKPGDPNGTLKSGPVRAIVELQVFDVADGDTIAVNNTAGQAVMVRIQGIDAPENGQSFNAESRKNLLKLLKGNWVHVEFEPRGKPDKAGRIIAKIYLDGTDVGLDQIRAGLAWYSKDYAAFQTESDRHTYGEAEKEARKNGRGLWKEPSPRPPWQHKRTP